MSVKDGGGDLGQDDNRQWLGSECMWGWDGMSLLPSLS